MTKIDACLECLAITGSNDPNWAEITSALAALAAVLFAALSVFQISKQLRAQQFSDFTKRYQEIIQRFPEDINSMEFEMVGREDYKQTMRAMRLYFDLCFEEWFLYQRNYLATEFWNLWTSGMRTAMSKPAFRQAWQIIVADTRYGVEFEEFLKQVTPKV